MNIGEAIRTTRIELGLTQEQVCKHADLTQGFYSRIENGFNDPSIETLQRISDTFKLPVLFIIWMAIDRRELNKRDREWYDNLSYQVESAIKQLITKCK